MFLPQHTDAPSYGKRAVQHSHSRAAAGGGGGGRRRHPTPFFCVCEQEHGGCFGSSSCSRRRPGDHPRAPHPMQVRYPPSPSAYTPPPTPLPSHALPSHALPSHALPSHALPPSHTPPLETHRLTNPSLRSGLTARFARFRRRSRRSLRSLRSLVGTWQTWTASQNQTQWWWCMRRKTLPRPSSLRLQGRKRS